jgi:hypothetical protein
LVCTRDEILIRWFAKSSFVSPLLSSPQLSLAVNEFDGALPEGMKEMKSMKKAHFENNVAGFAENINHILCTTTPTKIDQWETLTMGPNRPGKDCVCCTTSY